MAKKKSDPRTGGAPRIGVSTSGARACRCVQETGGWTGVQRLQSWTYDIRNSMFGPRAFDPKLLEVQSDVWAAFSQKRKAILMIKLN